MYIDELWYVGLAGRINWQLIGYCIHVARQIVRSRVLFFFRIPFLLASKTIVVCIALSFCLIALWVPVIIVFIPAVGAFLSLLLGRFIGRVYLIYFILINILLSCCGSLSNFFLRHSTFSNSTAFFSGYSSNCSDWFESLFPPLSFDWVFDDLSIVMLVLVSSVSLLVHLYSVNYMWSDPSLLRFLAYLSLFTFFMFFLSTSSNLLQFFFGWEGVGLMSYLLVSFWHSRQQASKAALKAVYVNRVGDFFLLIGMVLVYVNFRTLDFFTLFSYVYINAFEITRLFDSVGLFLPSAAFGSFDLLHLAIAYKVIPFLVSALSTSFYLEIITFLFFLSAVAKSAQLGLHAWLPDAMEGPTPVSALIHAATMVTAGVYLLLRCSPLLVYSSFFTHYSAFFGAITCVYAGVLACMQSDAKKLIAYSTMSQLGYMILGCSAGGFSSAFFHLWIHGYIKALLFLGIGAIIHLFSDEQSLLRFGGAGVQYAFLFVVLTIGSISLMALPFFSGYFSKEPLINLALFAPGFGLGKFIYCFSVVGSLFTGLYSSKLVSLVYAGIPNGPVGIVRSSFDRHAEPRLGLLVFMPLSLLCLASLFFGFCFFRLIHFEGGSYGSNLSSFALAFDAESILFFTNLVGHKTLDTAFGAVYFFLAIHWFIQPFTDLLVLVHDFEFFVSPLFFALVGFCLGCFIYIFNVDGGFASDRLVLIYVGARKVYFDKVVNFFVARRGLLTFYRTFWQSIDKGFLENFGPAGIVRLFIYFNRRVSSLQSRRVSFVIASVIWAASGLLFFSLLFWV